MSEITCPHCGKSSIYFTISEAAEITGVSRNTVRWWVDKALHKLSSIRLGDAAKIILAEDLINYEPGPVGKPSSKEK